MSTYPSRALKDGHEAPGRIREGQMRGRSGRRLAKLAASGVANRRQLLNFEVLPPRPTDQVGGRCFAWHVGEAKAIEATSEALAGR